MTVQIGEAPVVRTAAATRMQEAGVNDVNKEIKDRQPTAWVPQTARPWKGWQTNELWISTGRTNSKNKGTEDLE